MNYKITNRNHHNRYAQQVWNYDLGSLQIAAEANAIQVAHSAFDAAQLCHFYGVHFKIDAKLASLGEFNIYLNRIKVREMDTVRGVCVFLHELGHYHFQHGAYRSFKDFLTKEIQADAFMWRVCEYLPEAYQVEAAALVEYVDVSRASYDAIRKAHQKKVRQIKRFSTSYAHDLGAWCVMAALKVVKLQARFDKSGNATVGKWLENAIAKAAKAKARYDKYVAIPD